MADSAALSPASPEFSVVVPVYNDWDLVPGLIECLVRQETALAFEVLLVDNGSRALPGDLRLPAFVGIQKCRNPGSYSARNHAVMAARGQYIAFTDADCRPRPEWLEAAYRALCAAGGERVIVAGGIVVCPNHTKARTASELYDTAMGLPQREYVARGYGVTANLVVPRETFECIGGFDDKRFSGADADFCRRAAGAGVPTRYCAEARVEHPARQCFRELAKKKRRIKGGQVSHGTMAKRMGFVFRTFLPPLYAWRKALRADGYTYRQKGSVVITQTRLWGVEMWEVLRLMVGGTPRRS